MLMVEQTHVQCTVLYHTLLISAAEEVSPDKKKKVMLTALNISHGLQWFAER